MKKINCFIICLGVFLAFLLMLCSYTKQASAGMYPGRYKTSHHGFWVVIDQPANCMACHDGVISTNITPRYSGCYTSIKNTHPAFIKYPHKTSGKKAFHPATEIESQGLILFNGQVVCTTCHNLLNKDRGHLAVSIRQSKLCRVCHVR